MPRGTVLQWMVARALCEGAPSTKGRVAALMDVDVSAVYARAAAEGWLCIDWRSGRLQALQREIVAASAAERDPDAGAWTGTAADAGAAGAFAALAGGSEGADAAGAGPDAGAAALAAAGFTGTGAAAETPADRDTAADAGAAAPFAGVAGDVSRPVDGADAAGAGVEIDAVEGIDPVDRELDGAAFLASARPARETASVRLPALDGSDPVAVLASASAFVARQVAALIDRAERTGGRLDRKQIDGLSAFARMMERWETLATERAKENHETDAAELADLTRRVDERIVELAALEARRLVASGYRAGEDD